MSWVTVLWSAVAGASLTLGGVHLFVWCRNRTLRANLWFAATAISIAVVAGLEWSLMHAKTPAEFLTLHRWGHVATLCTIAGVVGFVQAYFRTGRRWLAWTVVGLRVVVVVLAFVPGPTFNFREITELLPFELFGETVAVPKGVASPWARLGEASVLLLVAFVVDAGVRLWRNGSTEEQRRAAVVGGSVVLFFGVCIANALLVHTGVQPMPYFISLGFLFMVAAMSFELSSDLVRAARMADELRENAKTMRQMRDRFRLSVEASPNGVILADVEGHILLANERATKMFGYEDGELMGQQVEVLVPDRFRRGHARERGRFHAAPTTRAMGAGRDLYGRRKDGSEFPVEIGLNPIDSEEGTLVLSVIVDISARKEADEALRESEARFRMVANSAPVMIWMAGVDKLCTFFNKGWLDFTGRLIEEELGNGWAEGVHADDFDRCVKTYHKAFDAREAFRMEYRLRRSDGEHCWVLDNGVPHFAPDGAFLGYIGTAIDISALRHAQAEAAQQRDELAHVARVASLTELSGSIAHELNQPLAIILSNAQAAQRLLAQDPPDVPEVREILKDVVAEDQRAGEVIRGLRALLKRGEVKPMPLSMHEAIDEVLQLLHADLIKRGITVVRELAEDLPQVIGDRIQLQQVVLNLITNGADAMSTGAQCERRLHIATRHDNGEVHLSIRDHGCGLLEDSEQIFAPFHTTKPNGLGMGLAISRSIVTAHRGRLWAETHPERGAIFHLELPALKANGG